VEWWRARRTNVSAALASKARLLYAVRNLQLTFGTMGACGVPAFKIARACNLAVRCFNRFHPGLWHRSHHVTLASGQSSAHT
jgi:hypothetical protein